MIKQIIDGLDNETLKNFVFEFAKENDVFRNRLEIRFAKPKLSEDSANTLNFVEELQ
jgi:hypothetical protein